MPNKEKNKTKSKGEKSIPITEDPMIQPESPATPVDDSQITNAPNVTKSSDAETICNVCSIVEEGEWLVQCDGCDQYYHFKCVGFIRTGEDDPWSCDNCTQKILSSTTQNSDVSKQVDKTHVQEREKVVSSAEVINPNPSHEEQQPSDIAPESMSLGTTLNPRYEREKYVAECAKLSQEFTQRVDNLTASYRQRRISRSLPELEKLCQSSEVQSVAGSVEQIRNLSNKVNDMDARTDKTAEDEPGHRKYLRNANVSQKRTELPKTQQAVGRASTSISSKVHSVSSKTSKFSSRWLRDIELKRVQEEYELERQMDEEKLALERKALELKEMRERKLMEAKYRAMEDIVSIRDASSAGARSVTKPPGSEHSKKSVRSSLVSNWIQQQRNQNYTEKDRQPLDTTNNPYAYSVNLSIPVEKRELRQIHQRQLSRSNNVHTTTEVHNQKFLDDSSKMQPNADDPTDLAMAYAYSRRYIPLPKEREKSSGYRSLESNPRISWNFNEQYGKQSTQVQTENTNYSDRDNRCDGFSSTHNQRKNSKFVYSDNQRSDEVQTSTQFRRENSSCVNDDNLNNTFSIPPGHLPSTQLSRRSDGTINRQIPIKLTPNQIAARQTVAKDGLPIFNGHPNDWIQFIKTYEDTTELCGFSDSENLNRLRKCLQGKARDLVESQLFMPDCVEQIIDALRERFGKPELIAQATLDKIRAVPPIKPDKLEALADFGYKVRNACKVIESMGMHFYLYDPDLVREIVKKLPCQTKIDWARYAREVQSAQAHVNLRTIADWLHNLAKTLNLVTTLDLDSLSSEQNSQRKADRKTGFVNYHEKPKSEETSLTNTECPSCSKNCKYVGECSKFKELNVDDRWKLVIEKKMCRKCLRSHGRFCTNTKFRSCGVSGCELKHNSLLHNEERHSKFNPNNSNYEKREVEKVTENNTDEKRESTNRTITAKPNNVHQVGGEEEIFRILPIILHCNGMSKETFAFFDEGSSYTLMEKHIADELNATGTKENICLLWTKGIHRQEESLNVNLEISGVKGFDVKHQLRSVNVVDDLGLAAQTIDPQGLGKRFRHLRGLPLPKYNNAVPTILIGLRHIRLTTPIETVEGGENEPIASRSRLGWTVCGPIEGKGSSGHVNHHVVSKCPCKDRDQDLHKIVKDHFTIENFGVSVNSMDTESKENKKALEMLKKYTIRKGNRFETRLLWKNEAYKLPDSYGMARKRLTCVENKGAEVVKVINDIINDYLTKEYASKLSPDELKEKHPRTFYLPIFTVTNPKKPGKIRPVFDAAATVNGTSLNSTLLTGPDLLSPLVDILRRFREHRIAVAGDIEEMFYRVLVNEEDRHSQRFLWRNGDKSREPDVYQFNVMTFGSKCSPTAAQFVKNTNAEEYKVTFPAASNSIIKNHYVDDMLDGANTIGDTIQLINDVKYVHSRAGFNIRNFKSNSNEVLTAIGEPIEANKVDLAEHKVERVLGMFWDTESDCFKFSLKYTRLTPEILQGKTLPTKRELLRLTMSLFDPLGLISYYVIHARILMQNAWRTQIGWDEKLPENLAENWYRWVRLLQGVEDLKIPRWYSTKFGSNSTTTTELHIFVDAGEDAFAAVAYLRITDDEGTECSLIGSKARVTPLKYLSNTRRELMAAVLGSRLVNSVKDGLSTHIERKVIWSDSTTVLTWLHSEHRKYSQFVAHRVGEILESTNLTEWRWVPTKLNVADEATKWGKIPSFDASSRWFTAPEFLQHAENEWPPQKIIIPNSTTEEMRISCSHSRLIMPSIVDATKFSTWQRLLRAVANAKRISSWMVAKHRRMELPTLKLSQKDLLESERKLIRQAQWEGFTEEMTILTRNQTRESKRQKPVDAGSPIKDCTPYLDEFGLLRVKGRIDSATAVTSDAKRPIILPKDNPVTRLIVFSYHARFQHRNHESVVNELKQKFYIPQIRTVVRSVRWKCKLCALRRCRPRNPQMADLPPIRFEAGIRPFTFTGIDYFGPFKVKVGRQYPKRWGVIYTCLTTRAVWIDIVPSYDTEACILSIRDFINRKGVVQEFYTDNGSNFKGANKELTDEIKKIDFKRLSDEYTSCYTKWNFNPPETPHMGGMWERLVRAVKVSLYDSMSTRTPTDQMLRSWLIEAENIINSRPLTFVPVESEDDESLIPNHFMLGSSNGLKPPGNFKSDGSYLRRQWKEVQRCTDIFWRRFIKEYCPTLIRRTKWFEQVKPLEVGDLVINFDENAPRNTYKRARVVETIIGTNEQVRRAKVQFPNGSTLWRSANKLGLLDVNATQAPTDKVLDHPLDDKNEGENVGAPISSERSPTGTGIVMSTVSLN